MPGGHIFPRPALHGACCLFPTYHTAERLLTALPHCIDCLPCDHWAALTELLAFLPSILTDFLDHTTGTHTHTHACTSAAVCAPTIAQTWVLLTPVMRIGRPVTRGQPIIVSANSRRSTIAHAPGRLGPAQSVKPASEIAKSPVGAVPLPVGPLGRWVAPCRPQHKAACVQALTMQPGRLGVRGTGLGWPANVCTCVCVCVRQGLLAHASTIQHACCIAGQNAEWH